MKLQALSLLAGCATTTDVDRAKASWHGASYDEVVAAWGQPATHTTLRDELQAHPWNSKGAGGYAYGSSVGVFGGSGGGAIGISLPLPGMGGTASGECQRTLSFAEGRVVDQIGKDRPSTVVPLVGTDHNDVKNFPFHDNCADAIPRYSVAVSSDSAIVTVVVAVDLGGRRLYVA